MRILSAIWIGVIGLLLCSCISTNRSSSFRNPAGNDVAVDKLVAGSTVIAEKKYEVFDKWGVGGNLVGRDVYVHYRHLITIEPGMKFQVLGVSQHGRLTVVDISYDVLGVTKNGKLLLGVETTCIENPESNIISFEDCNKSIQWNYDHRPQG